MLQINREENGTWRPSKESWEKTIFSRFALFFVGAPLITHTFYDIKDGLLKPSKKLYTRKIYDHPVDPDSYTAAVVRGVADL